MADVTLRALLLGDDRSASSAMKGVAREIDKVVERLMTLSRMDATPEVKVKTAEAQAELARLQAEMKALGTETETLGKKTETTHKQMGALATTVLALGPALVPVAAGAAGLAAGWSAMGAAGVLAFIGVRNEMQAGTQTGQAFSAGMDRLKGNLQGLASVAANGVLSSFQSTVSMLQQRMPVLTQMVGEFSSMTGRTAANVTTGLVSAFVALEPLMRDVGVYTVNLSQHFASLMSGQGIVSFGDYARSVLPQVLATLESLVTSAAHLIAALAPLGGGTLAMLKMLSDVLAAIPVDVLSKLATFAGAAFLGFRTWSGLSALIGGVGGSLERLGISAAASATAIRGLQAAAGVIGIALAGISIAMSMFSTNSASAAQTTNDFTDALIASNGALDDNVRKTAAKKLMDSGALDAANQLGISQKLVTDAVVGASGAHEELNRQIDAFTAKQVAAQQGTDGTTQKMADQNNALVVLKGVVGDTSGQFADATKNQRDYAAATAASKDATSGASVEVALLAQTYGVSISTYQAAASAQQQQADAARQATVKMQLENDAAGLLKQSLDALNGKALSAAQAQNSFDSSLANMGDHVTATGKKIHFTTTSINDMSSASVTLRGQLLGQVTAAEQTAEAYGQMTGSSEKGRAKLVDLRKQIIDNAVAHGVDRKAVEDYINKVLDVNKLKVKPTKLDTDKAAAEQKARDFIGVINGVPTWRTTTLSINVVSNVNAAVAGIRSTVASIGGSFGWGGPAHARGGTNLPAGWSLVGEEGPEIMYVPGGSTILDAQKTAGVLSGSGAGSGAGMPGAGGGSGQPVVVQFVLDGRVVQQSLLKFKRTNGGVALGLA